MCSGAVPTAFPFDLTRLLALRALCDAVTADPEATLQLLTAPPERAQAIGVLAGSFNPLTTAHAALIGAALADGLDAALLLLPARAVHKEAVERAVLYDRVLVAQEWATTQRRVGLALINRGLYVEQVALLAAQFPHQHLCFIVGYDKIVQIFDPRYYTDRTAALDILFSHATFRVAPRAGHGPTALHDLLEQGANRAYASKVHLLSVDAEVDDLSSTVVREAAWEGQPWASQVPPATALFMEATHPYSRPFSGPDGATIDRYGLRLAVIDAVSAGQLDRSAVGDLRAFHGALTAATPEGAALRRWLQHLSGATGS